MLNLANLYFIIIDIVEEFIPEYIVEINGLEEENNCIKIDIKNIDSY